MAAEALEYMYELEQAPYAHVVTGDLPARALERRVLLLAVA